MTKLLRTIFLGTVLMGIQCLVWAQVVVDVSGTKAAARKVLVLPVPDDRSRMDYTIAGDLHKSGYFQPVDPQTLRLTGTTHPDNIDYAGLQKNGIEYLVLGHLLSGGRVQFVLVDVHGQRLLSNDTLHAESRRQMAHDEADRILQRLTGRRGAFATPIAYVLEQDRSNGRRYALMVSGIDGANRREVFSSSEPIVSPRWSPDGRNLVFMTYARGRSQIVVENINSGAKRVVVSSDSISSAPTFSPDGRRIAFAQSSNNNPDIYILDLASGAKRQLTHHAGIDTEPVFSPDGRWIYFTSDRQGAPQIYRVPVGGGSPERVVVGAGFVTGGELAPDGQSLVLTRKSGGAFQIGLYDLKSKQFRALTLGKLDEGASFSPDGRMIVYTAKEGARSLLRVITRGGGRVLSLSDPGGRLYDPSWGPDTRHTTH